MNTVSKSPLQYFQRRANGRRYGHNYKVLQREDPFRSGQIAYQPRLGTKLNTIERMISKPCPAKARLRDMY